MRHWSLPKAKKYIWEIFLTFLKWWQRCQAPSEFHNYPAFLLFQQGLFYLWQDVMCAVWAGQVESGGQHSRHCFWPPECRATRGEGVGATFCHWVNTYSCWIMAGIVKSLQWGPHSGPAACCYQWVVALWALALRSLYSRGARIKDTNQEKTDKIKKKIPRPRIYCSFLMLSLCVLYCLRWVVLRRSQAQ